MVFSSRTGFGFHCPLPADGKSQSSIGLEWNKPDRTEYQTGGYLLKIPVSLCDTADAV